MSSYINASTTTGIQYYSDASGVLQFQANGSPVLTLSSVNGVTGLSSGSITSALGYTPLSANTNGSLTGNLTVTGAVTSNTLYVGQQVFAAAGVLGSLNANTNSYTQFAVTNANNGTQASADFIVNNNLASDYSYYGDFGINSSNFTGSGSLSLANAVYLYASNSDLSIGTYTSGNVHILANNSTTDAITVYSNNVPFITNPTITGYTETTYTANTGAAITISLTNGTVQVLTCNNNTTITLPASVVGKSFTLVVNYPYSSNTITWAGGSTLKWPGGTTPTITATAGRYDIFTFFQDGTNTYGQTYGLNF